MYYPVVILYERRQKSIIFLVKVFYDEMISKYTNGVEIKSTRKEIGLSRMNKGRKTTFEERIEIAQYTIANDLDYQKSMEKYDVSYSQVYAWVRKYKSGNPGSPQGQSRS
ncbi:helix-turn-helix domain-containing protein [Paenibacillus larvae]|nr:helix-turn-helix domain-containing protein [Paenibacillus larvae]MDT2286762.1 helix-turn-helix domain-containing protein [Paenibacillus larvae]